MKREELKSHPIEQINFDLSGKRTLFEFYFKGQADSVMDAMEKRIAELEEIEHKYNQLCWQHEALQDEDEKLEKRIKALEDELQVANRCAEDAKNRIKELEHDNNVLTSINKEKVRIIKELEAENTACREELDHEREQFALTLAELESNQRKWIGKVASNVSYQVWDEIMKRLKDVPDAKMSIGCNDISDIILNKILMTEKW